MKKGTILLGLIATLFVLSFFSPEDLIQTSVQTVIENNRDISLDQQNFLDQRDLQGQSLPKQLTIEGIPESKTYFKSYQPQKSFYEDAYNKSASGAGVFDEKVFAGILPHHLVFPEYIAEYFDKLAASRSVDTFFVIGPNHFYRGKKIISVSKYGFNTPYGNIEPDTFKIDKILSGDSSYIGFDVNAFNEEHSISSLVPFIKKSFPNAKIVPIVIKGTVTPKSLDKLFDVLKNVVGPNDFVLGSIDFSHYMLKNVADFHDELTESVIKNLDFEGIDNTEIDSHPSLYLVMKYADSAGASDVEILHHTNSAERFGGEEAVPETTSHFYIAFKDGESDDENAVGRQVTIMAVGDIMLGRYVRTLSEKNADLTYPFAKIKGGEDRFFQGADIFFGNLEGPIFGAGYESGTSTVFGFNEDTAPILGKFGFDVLSTANNHTLNQGINGFDSTVKALNGVGISSCGNPADVSENSVVYKTIDGQKISFICFEDAQTRLNVDDAVSLIEKVDAEVDFSIVSIHFGVEYEHKPTQRQRDLAHKFVDAGADAVIGTHPHVVQGFESYRGVPIFYSLGNFIFDQYWSYDTQEQLGIGIILPSSDSSSDSNNSSSTKVYLFPMKSDKSQPYLLSGEEKKKFYDRFISWGGYSDFWQTQIRSGSVEFSK